jgi:hypothetical protein
MPIEAESMAVQREFVEVMTAAGWDVQDFTRMLEAGVDVEPAAIATHRGEQLVLDLGLRVTDRRLSFDVFDPADGALLACLRLHPKQQREVLEWIVRARPRLDQDNLISFLPTFINRCDRVVLQEPDAAHVLSVADDGTLVFTPTESDDTPGTAIWG